jgi:hypothetical protein
MLAFEFMRVGGRDSGASPGFTAVADTRRYDASRECGFFSPVNPIVVRYNGNRLRTLLRNDGERYPHLVRIPDKSDYWDELLKPEAR